jgi:hypothetical protein|tara:strand:+ start:6840 stop:7076 length:237 start_codon:yes stop_codon:yes gene_type:complete
MTDATENEVQTLTFDDVEYAVNDLSNKAKYILSQIQDLNGQASQHRAKLDQAEVALQGFTGILREELLDKGETDGGDD